MKNDNDQINQIKKENDYFSDTNFGLEYNLTSLKKQDLESGVYKIKYLPRHYEIGGLVQLLDSYDQIILEFENYPQNTIRQDSVLNSVTSSESSEFFPRTDGRLLEKQNE